jgi:hypothetical protein
MKPLLDPPSSVAEALARARARLTSPIHELGPDPLQPWPERHVGGVLCDGVLWAPAWDHDALVEVRHRLGSRRLIAVEPVSGLGLRRVVQWLATPSLRRRLGHHFNRDLPIELRAAGFTIDAIDRFSPGRLTARTYAYLELSAPNASDQHRPGPAPAQPL